MKVSKFLLRVSTICIILFVVVESTPKVHKVVYTDIQYVIEDKNEYNWFEAFLECSRRNMQLVTIDEEEKNNQLLDVIKEYARPLDLWIGGNDQLEKTDVQKRNKKSYWTSTGEEMSFTYWYPRNPDFNKTNEHCVHTSSLSPNHRWLYSDCYLKYGFICEEKPFHADCDRLIQETSIVLDQMLKEAKGTA